MAAKKNVTDQYRDYMTKVGRSPYTVKNYGLDLTTFGCWFEQTTGEDFYPRAVDPRDMRDFRVTHDPKTPNAFGQGIFMIKPSARRSTCFSRCCRGRFGGNCEREDRKGLKPPPGLTSPADYGETYR